MSRSGNFRGDDDRQTDYFTPAHARGVTSEQLVDASASPELNSLRAIRYVCTLQRTTALAYTTKAFVELISVVSSH